MGDSDTPPVNNTDSNGFCRVDEVFFLHIYLLIINIPILFKQVPEQSRVQMFSHAQVPRSKDMLVGTSDSPSSSQSG